MTSTWYDRAEQAYRAVDRRFCRPVKKITGFSLAASQWPDSLVQASTALLGCWNYWWQAHYLDCVIDAALRTHNPQDIKKITAIIRSHYVRNYFSVINDYYDDMAWLGLAVQRANVHFRILPPHRLDVITLQLYQAWLPQYGGGIRWRKEPGELYFNAAAAGPAGIFHARSGEIERAHSIAEWVYEQLCDPQSGLIVDGRYSQRETTLAAADESEKYILSQPNPMTYTYNQGVLLGLDLELLLATGDQRYARRIVALVQAVDKHMTHDGIIISQGSGDGGLFPGILARYLTQVAIKFPGENAQARNVRELARNIVFTSAAAAWDNAIHDRRGVFFGIDWSVSPADDVLVTDMSRDLSIQLSGWKLCEAAYCLTQHDLEEDS